jgi:hypothetical protein
LNSSIPQTPPIPLIASFPSSEGNRCSQSRQSVCAKTDAAVGQTAQAGISDAELVAHIADCRLLMRLAQARFRGSHAAKDLQDAEFWEARMDEGIKARQDASIERKAAEAQDGLTFAGKWTDEVLARSGAYFDVNPAAVRRRMA